MTVAATSMTGAIFMTFPEHRPIELNDYSRLRAELEVHGRRDLVDPFADVDRQLLDEMLARSLVGGRRRSWSGRRAVLAATGLLATLILIVWLA